MQFLHNKINENGMILKLLRSFLIMTHIIKSSCSACPASSVATVKRVPRCPENIEEWKRASWEKNCSSTPQNCTTAEPFEYHCLLNPFLNATLEVCAKRKIILGYCAEFNSVGEVVQENYNAPCLDFNPPCPTRYNSTDAYKYTGCYPATGKVKNGEKSNKDQIWFIPSISAVAGVIFIGIILLIYKLYFKQRCPNLGTEHTDTEIAGDDEDALLMINIGEPPRTDEGQDNFFYETATYKIAYEKLQNQDILILNGVSGTGKTATANHLLRKFESKGFTLFKCQYPEDLTKRKEKSGKVLFFIDDLFNCKPRERIQWLEKLGEFINLLERESCSESACCKLIATVKTSLRDFTLSTYTYCNNNFSRILEDREGNHLVTFELKPPKSEMKSILEYTAKKLHCSVPDFSEEKWEDIYECELPFGFPLCANLFMAPQKSSSEHFFPDPSVYLDKEINNDIKNNNEMATLFYLLTIQEFDLTNKKRRQEIDLAHMEECTKVLTSYSPRSGKFEWNQNVPILARKYVDYYFKFGKGESKYHFNHESVRDAVLKYLLQHFFSECVDQFPLDILCSEFNVRLSENMMDIQNSLSILAGRLILALEEKEDVSEICSYSIFRDATFLAIFFQELKDREQFKFFLTAADKSNEYPVPYWFAYYGSELILENILENMGNKDDNISDRQNNLNISSIYLIVKDGVEVRNETLFYIFAGLCNSKNPPSIEWMKRTLSSFCSEDILNICFACLLREKSCHHISLLDLSYSNYNKDIVRFLLIGGSKFHRSTWNGWDFLRAAAEHGDEHFFSQNFLQKIKEFDLESYNKDEEEKTPEEIIHDFHNEKDFLLNLATKCNPSIKLSSKTVKSVLSVADVRKSNDAREILSSCNEKGETLLHVIVNTAYRNRSTMKDTFNLLEYLMCLGADVDVTDCNKKTPLMRELAKTHPDPDIVKLLLSFTKNVNLCENNGRNLLHTFFMKQRTSIEDYSILKMLLKKGVSKTHQDIDRQSPYDFAQKNKSSTQIRSYLIRN